MAASAANGNPKSWKPDRRRSGPSPSATRGRKPSTNRPSTSARVTSICVPPPISFDPAAGRFKENESGPSSASSDSFTPPGRPHQHLPPPAVELPVVGETLLDVPGEREVQVVAAQQQVVADRHAVKLQVARLLVLAHADQREVARPPADVANQDFLPRRDPPTPVVRVPVDPGVERRLRFFEQHHPRQARSLRRRQCQFARHLVERSGQSDHNVLFRQRVTGEPVVPSLVDVPQQRRRRLDGREPLHVRVPSPRQQVGRPVHAGVRQPRFRRGDHPPRFAGALFPRVDPHRRS